MSFAYRNGRIPALLTDEETWIGTGALTVQEYGDSYENVERQCAALGIPPSLICRRCREDVVRDGSRAVCPACGETWPLRFWPVPDVSMVPVTRRRCEVARKTYRVTGGEKP